MKKKIILLAAMLMLITGVVSASSLNGDYKGNPIVKVKINGSDIFSDVPAIIYDGSTLIPLRSVVESMGGQVDWDSSKNTANIFNPNSKSEELTIEQIGIGGNDHNISFVTYNVSANGNNMLVYYLNQALLTNSQSFEYIAKNCAEFKAKLCQVNDNLGAIYSFLKSDAKNYNDGVTNKTSFFNTMTIDTSNMVSNQNEITTPTSNLSPSLENSNTIESKIDGDFEGWTGETIFKLSNGQIWQQDSYAYTYHYSYMPKVLIYKDGTRYKMKVDGVDDTIFVKQLN